LILVEMLDPFTALSLAATIVQFVDFGSKILSDSREIYKAGSISDHGDIKLITTDLAALAGRIQHDIGPASDIESPLNPNVQVSPFP
jgi:hypothetical protein